MQLCNTTRPVLYSKFYMLPKNLIAVEEEMTTTSINNSGMDLRRLSGSKDW